MSRRKKVAPAIAAPGVVAPISAVGAPSSSEPGRTVGFQTPPAATSPNITTPVQPEATMPPPSAVAPPAPPVVTGSQPSSSPETHPHFCASCGHELKPDARFCPSCGHPVED